MLARSIALLFAAALVIDVAAAHAQTPPPATTEAPGTASDPAQKPTTPSPGDVHETPPPMQTSAPPTPGTATPPAEPKTDSKPPPETKPK